MIKQQQNYKYIVVKKQVKRKSREKTLYKNINIAIQIYIYHFIIQIDVFYSHQRTTI
jgi:hypothetical protein